HTVPFAVYLFEGLHEVKHIGMTIVLPYLWTIPKHILYNTEQRSPCLSVFRKKYLKEIQCCLPSHLLQQGLLYAARLFRYGDNLPGMAEKIRLKFLFQHRGDLKFLAFKTFKNTTEQSRKGMIK